MLNIMDNIYNSAYNGDFDIIKDKLEETPSLLTTPDSNSRLLIHWASMSGNIKLVKHLLELGSPVDPKDETEVTPFILAASAGKTDVCKILVDQGANIDTKNTQGHSALQYACSKGWLEIAEMILIQKGDVNIMDIRGATPLHRAASKGNTAIVQLLLDQPDIHVDCKDIYGNTPLHLACEEDRVEEAKLLVKHGADVGAINKESKTPIDLCNYSLARVIKNMRTN